MSARDSSIDWDQVSEPGTPVPTLTRLIDQPAMVAYAGATWDWHRLHYDMDFAKTLGFSGPVVDGQVFGALMAECLQDWLGPQAWIRELSFRFKTPVVAGATVRCEGETTDAQECDLACNLRIVVVDDSGAEIATAAVGEARVIRR